MKLLNCNQFTLTSRTSRQAFIHLHLSLRSEDGGFWSNWLNFIDLLHKVV